MINTNDFKTGQTIKLNNDIYQIIEFLHVKPGKGAAFVRSKLKNLKNGYIIEHNFNAGVKVEKAVINKLKLQFSYISNENYVFLDPDTFESFEITKDKLNNVIKYLKENMLVEVIFDDKQEVLSISLDDKISLKVVETDSLTTSNTTRKSTSYKNATLETGLVIKVPIFIEENENIIVNTETGLYVSRDVNK
ncbi:elongation factor P [Candidatus Phytoplasma luffae]|uniref:Elongation factor P n=1 Tax=Loofah witches'-broom phytoplasma TaxID=35773 RepID=A0A975FL37_LOWBP|nr:elongation factor P [Candidatus Phytoplasma luffae]QTX02941.1 elongation factor P [Candidatus Phytoplasma luffae]QTX02960.1 elongation factor P [Candidatus Phytoplasma luffae]